MLWLVVGPSLTKLLCVELWLSFIYASYNGALLVLMTEIVTIHVRTLGFSTYDTGRLVREDHIHYKC